MKEQMKNLLEELMFALGVGEHMTFVLERHGGDSTQVTIFDEDDQGNLVMIVGLIKWDDLDSIVPIADRLHRTEVAETLLQLEKYDGEKTLHYSNKWGFF